MFEVFLIFLGIFLFSLLVVLHEYGHFLVAKRNGVEVKEFGLGFPPKIVGKTFGKGIFRSYYSLNLFPIGGFVRLEGENDEATGRKSYGSKSLWVKTKIILAGVVVNFLIATFLFTLLALIGIPKLLPAEPNFSDEQFSLASDTQIIEKKILVSWIDEDSPAEEADLKLGDEVVSFSSENQFYLIENSDHLNNLTLQLAGQVVEIQVVRDRADQTIETELRTVAEAEAANSGRLGISTSDFIIQRNTWSAPITGVALTYQYSKVTLQGLGQVVGSLFKGDTQTASESVTGPIGIFFILKASAEHGVRLILMLIALISLTLAIINSLPIPALDGGRLMLTLFFRKVLKKPLVKSVENKIVGISMIFLLSLMALITFVDLNRFIF